MAQAKSTILSEKGNKHANKPDSSKRNVKFE